MPRRADIRSIMVIGSGPIVIGQACEFDYSGTQACKVLRREGFHVSLVNSNPATIMTDPQFADRTYIEPLDPASVLAVLERERPDALLPTLGGQTGLNVAVALAESGDLDRLGIRLIGASLEAIHRAEDRSGFKRTMLEAGLEVPRAEVAHTLDEALALGDAIGYPVIVRPSFTLGGGGSGFAHTHEELGDLARRSLEISPVGEILVEESIAGWKEFELEVMRDGDDNGVIICSIENVDPMGVHTGDSDHRGSGADADGRGIPAHARRGAPMHPRDRRRDRRLQRAVRGAPARRAHGPDRDEPARLPIARRSRRRRPGSRSRRSPRCWRSGTGWTRSRTTSRARPRRRSSRRSTTWS